MRLLFRLLINAVALWVAVKVVGFYLPGQIAFNGTWLNLLLVALVFGILNAIVRPILAVLTCPLQILTLGLFTLVLNAIMLWLTGYVSSNIFDLGFHVNGLLAPLLGGLVISIVSVVLSIFVRDNQERRDH
jgi:putative membrane protein